MTNSTPSQLRFAPSAGFTIRADFNGGGLSSDLGPLLLRGVAQQIGLTARLTAALDDHRHPGYVKYALCDVLTQRIFQIASGYEYATPPKALVLDLDHSEDKAHGQQPLAFYNQHYRSTCYLPLFIFDGLSGALVTAALRPGKPNLCCRKRVRCHPDRTFPARSWKRRATTTVKIHHRNGGADQGHQAD